MITLSPGHHSLSPGARSEEHSEHAEACLWVGLIAAQLPGAQIVTGTTRQKLLAINMIRPALAVELHFGSGKLDSSSGTTVAAAGAYGTPARDTIATLRSGLEGIVPRFEATDGRYRGGEVDFFLAGAQVPALLVCIDDFRNLTWLQNKRAELCTVLAGSLTKIIEEPQ